MCYDRMYIEKCYITKERSLSSKQLLGDTEKMNGLEEIREDVKKFICEKKHIQQQICEIENKRIELAQIRNEKIRNQQETDDFEIIKLGQDISKLGNESQQLQNKLNSRSYELKNQFNLIVDNLIAEKIRKIRKKEEDVKELKNKKSCIEERKTKYQLQKNEFYIRFGRMPELSQNAKEELKTQEGQKIKYYREIKKIIIDIKDLENEISELAATKTELKYGNWSYIVENKAKEINIEEIKVEILEPIEEFYVEEFKPIEEFYVEEFQPIEEIKLEELEEQLSNDFEISTQPVDEIEKIARQIVEEIALEQENRIVKESKEEEIIKFEKADEKKENVIIPLFGKKTTISGIIVKFEEEKLLYKAQMSDNTEIKIYPTEIGEGNVLLRDKQNRQECEDILVNYAITEYKTIDKKVISKIDPMICELLIECAEKNGYDAQELIYNYAMSFSNIEVEDVETLPSIIYNLSYIEKSKLTIKEKAIINKICRNARKNEKVEIIETFTGFRKFKYILKRIFTVNNVKVLPEAKY